MALEPLGFTDVTTYVQSGNVVFGAPEAGNLAERIEAQVLAALGVSVKVVTRTADELGRVVAENPFLREPGIDLSKLHVTFLADVPADAPSARGRPTARPASVRCSGLLTPRGAPVGLPASS